MALALRAPAPAAPRRSRGLPAPPAASSAAVRGGDDDDLQGWALIRQEGECPGRRVGCTLSCLSVPLHSKGARKETEELGGEQQYGLFLFGGDDADGNQTDALHVFYLQEGRWVCPAVRGRPPTKRSRHTATVVPHGTGEQLLIFGGVGASNAVRGVAPPPRPPLPPHPPPLSTGCHRRHCCRSARHPFYPTRANLRCRCSSLSR